MTMKDLPQSEKYIRIHRFHRRWHKVLMLLCSVVAFCTTYALILPAITMAQECQIPEHMHTDACYTQAGVPVDSDVLTCTNTDEDHVHSERCYGTRVLTCGMEEHTHTGACLSGTESNNPAAVTVSGGTEQGAAGTLNVSLLYGDQAPQSHYPDGVFYYTHANMSGYLKLEPADWRLT